MHQLSFHVKLHQIRQSLSYPCREILQSHEATHNAAKLQRLMFNVGQTLSYPCREILESHEATRSSAELEQFQLDLYLGATCHPCREILESHEATRSSAELERIVDILRERVCGNSASLALR